MATVELILNAAAAKLVADRTMIKYFAKPVKGQAHLGLCPTKFVKAGSQFEDTTAKLRQMRGSVAVRLNADAVKALGVELTAGTRYELVEVCADKRIYRLVASDVPKGKMTDLPLATVAA